MSRASESGGRGAGFELDWVVKPMKNNRKPFVFSMENHVHFLRGRRHPRMLTSDQPVLRVEDLVQAACSAIGPF